jgi:hypothetical protein
LNAAAAITSLVLGVLAIIYSFVSSNSTNNFLGSVEASAREIRTIGTEMRSIVTSGQELQSRAEQRNDELHKLVDNLREALETVKKNTIEIAETLPSHFKDLSEEVRKSSQTNVPVQQTVSLKDLWKPEHYAAFLETASILGIAALKGMLDAQEAGKYCDLHTICGAELERDFDYLFGFLLASECAGVIQSECPDSLSLGNGKVRVKDPSQKFVEAVKTEWGRRLLFTDAKKQTIVVKLVGRIANSLVVVD